MSNIFLLLSLLSLYTSTNAKTSGIVRYPQEKRLKNVRQLTFGGQNAEGYFSSTNQQIVFQSSNLFGTSCDQIYKMDLSDPNSVVRISTGLGACTCSYFMPNNKDIIYASTYLASYECPVKACQSNAAKTNAALEMLCNTTYTWDIFPNYDIFHVNQWGNLVKKLTVTEGYDAEATLSPVNDKMVFTSMRSGDLELYTMNLDGSNVKQITNKLGYDGGAFFSPDGKKLVYRASRPNTTEEIEKYKLLLKYHLVSPTKMELFIVNADGTDMRQITELGGANWAPYYHPSGEKIIFSSNHHSATHGFNFNLFTVYEDGSKLEKITFDPIFDAFPMYSFDGKQLIFASARNGTGPSDLNLFLADWVENPTEGGGSGTTTENRSSYVINLVAVFFVIVYSFMY